MKRMLACLSENGLCTERRLVLSGLVQPACAQAHVSKQSFFEKRTKKLLPVQSATARTKVFGSFLKKKALSTQPASARRHTPRRPSADPSGSRPSAPG
jgi:hypothetical protein